MGQKSSNKASIPAAYFQDWGYRLFFASPWFRLPTNHEPLPMAEGSKPPAVVVSPDQPPTTALGRRLKTTRRGSVSHEPPTTAHGRRLKTTHLPSFAVVQCLSEGLIYLYRFDSVHVDVNQIFSCRFITIGTI
jgi:hypothetical protein